MHCSAYRDMDKNELRALCGKESGISAKKKLDDGKLKCKTKAELVAEFEARDTPKAQVSAKKEEGAEEEADCSAYRAMDKNALRALCGKDSGISVLKKLDGGKFKRKTKILTSFY